MYELSLEQYEWLLQTYTEQRERTLANLESHGDRYAPDLPEYGQKVMRANNLAVRHTARSFMREYEFGVQAVEDIAESEDRAIHHGVRIGDVVTIHYTACDDYMKRKAFVIKEVRSLVRIVKRAL